MGAPPANVMAAGSDGDCPCVAGQSRAASLPGRANISLPVALRGHRTRQYAEGASTPTGVNANLVGKRIANARVVECDFSPDGAIKEQALRSWLNEGDRARPS